MAAAKAAVGNDRNLAADSSKSGRRVGGLKPQNPTDGAGRPAPLHQTKKEGPEERSSGPFYAPLPLTAGS